MGIFKRGQLAPFPLSFLRSDLLHTSATDLHHLHTILRLAPIDHPHPHRPHQTQIVYVCLFASLFARWQRSVDSGQLSAETAVRYPPTPTGVRRSSPSSELFASASDFDPIGHPGRKLFAFVLAYSWHHQWVRR
jgi:hypothetical protein